MNTWDFNHKVVEALGLDITDLSEIDIHIDPERTTLTAKYLVVVDSVNDKQEKVIDTSYLIKKYLVKFEDDTEETE